jgi:outer membrane protein OmpU
MMKHNNVIFKIHKCNILKMINKVFRITGLACCSFLCITNKATATVAAAPSLTIHGNSIVNTYFVNQKNHKNGRGGPQPHITLSASNLYFTILGRSSNGLEYMYKINFQAYPGSCPTIPQNYIQFKGKFGTVQLGQTVGPEDFAIVDASKVIGGTGAFDGSFTSVYNMSAGVVRGNDIIGDTGNATKIVYISPKFMGWQFSIAYTPSTARQGSDHMDNNTGKGANSLPGNRGLYNYNELQPFGLRNVALSITYHKEVGQWVYSLSGSYLNERSYFNALDSRGCRFSLQNTRSYQLGALVKYGSWRFGAGWLDNGKSRLPHTDDFEMKPGINLDQMNRGNAGHAWNLGVGYTMGAYQFAASYQRTDRKTDAVNRANSDVYTATVDITLLQGLNIYIEVNYIQSQTNAKMIAREKRFIDKTKKYQHTIGNNSGVVSIIGTKVAC